MRRRVSVLGIVVSAVLVAQIGAQEDDINKLIEGVGSDDKAQCLHCIDELSKLGAEAQPAVAALAAALANDDTEICWHAARTLGGIGKEAADALPALTAGLGSEDASVRAYSAYALGQIGGADDATIDKLLTLAFDTDSLVRRAAMGAVRKLDPPVEKTLPHVLRLLEEADPEIVVHALQELAEEGEKAVPRLRQVLQHEKACFWACLVIADIGAAAKDAVPEVTEVVGHADPDSRLQAILALAAIGPDAKSAVPAIINALQTDEFEHVRYVAAYALGSIGAGGEAIDALAATAESDDEFLSTVSAWALAKIQPDDDAVVKAAAEQLVAALGSGNDELRTAAAQGLGDFDGLEDIVCPALVKALKDKDPNVVANARAALVALGPESLRGIASGLKNEALRIHAVKICQELGTEAAVAADALTESLVSAEDDEFRAEIQFALARIGPAASGAVGELIKSISSESEEVRGSACYALGKIGPEANDAVAALQELAGGDDPIMQRVSVWALLHITPDAPDVKAQALPLMIASLDSERVLVRIEASHTLGELGEASDEVIAALEKLLHDDNAAVRAAAAEALQKLKASSAPVDE